MMVYYLIHLIIVMICFVLLSYCLNWIWWWWYEWFYLWFRGGYTVLINSWKQNSLLKQSVAHHASCRSVDVIHVVWSGSEPPSEPLKTYLNKMVVLKSRRAKKPNFRFDIAVGDELSSRFKPIEDLSTDAVFSVDDDVIVPCSTLDFAFSVWQSAPLTMVGFVPRMHWLDKEVGDLLITTFSIQLLKFSHKLSASILLFLISYKWNNTFLLHTQPKKIK